MFVIDAKAMALLVPLYTTSDRHYHGLNHIFYCLSKLDEYVCDNFLFEEELKVLTHSIWFHDAIYSPFPHKATSNEKESAELFERFYEGYRLYKPNASGIDHFKLAVIQAIKATEHHLTLVANDENNHHYKTTDIMLDIDMAGFAKSFPEVYKDSDRVFKEYAILGMPVEVMMQHRIAFLTKLLEKERIYHTDYFHEKYEATARSNIEAVIEATKAELDK